MLFSMPVASLNYYLFVISFFYSLSSSFCYFLNFALSLFSLNFFHICSNCFFILLILIDFLFSQPLSLSRFLFCYSPFSFHSALFFFFHLSSIGLGSNRCQSSISYHFQNNRIFTFSYVFSISTLSFVLIIF